MLLQIDWYVQLHVVRWPKDELPETFVALKQHTAKKTTAQKKIPTSIRVFFISASSYADVAKSAPRFPKQAESGSFALVASKEDHSLDICLNGLFGLTLETPSLKLAENRPLLLTLSMLQKAAWVSQERALPLVCEPTGWACLACCCCSPHQTTYGSPSWTSHWVCGTRRSWFAPLWPWDVCFFLLRLRRISRILAAHVKSDASQNTKPHHATAKEKQCTHLWLGRRVAANETENGIPCV